MIRPGGFGRQQQKNEIHGLVVDGVEVDPLIEPREQPIYARKLRQFSVGDGDSNANPRGPEPLAFEKDFEDDSLLDPG